MGLCLYILLVSLASTKIGSQKTTYILLDWVKTGFQIEVLTLIHNLTENRTRQARGPVHNISSVTNMQAKTLKCNQLQTGFSPRLFQENNEGGEELVQNCPVISIQIQIRNVFKLGLAFTLTDQVGCSSRGPFQNFDM